MIESKSEAVPVPFLRAAKAILVAGVALLVSLVAFGNITDYETNFAFVQHVLMMDTIFPNATIRYRAITSPPLHHAAYLLIIAVEVVTAVLCWFGALSLAWHLRDTVEGFCRAKRTAVAGLTLGFLLWQVGFIAIGGEWFGMWMSQQWNGIPSAFRCLMMTMGVLIFLVLPEPRSQAEPFRRDQ
jgi:predicted small integral membrane protein